MKLFISIIITLSLLSGIMTPHVSANSSIDSLFDGLFDSIGTSENTSSSTNSTNSTSTQDSLDDLFDGLFDSTGTDNSTDSIFDGIFNSAPEDDLFDGLFDGLFDSTGTNNANNTSTDTSLDGLFDGIFDPEEPVPINNYVYSNWELQHRSAMLDGFMWTGDIAQFISPQMYVGTPFKHDGNYTGDNNPFASYLTEEPGNYTECIRREAYLSFGLGDLVEDTDIKELKSIAKECAREFYGSYFNGKSYTTREEFLMMIFTMFEEKNIGFQGTFSKIGTYIKNKNDNSISGYTNIDPKVWYAGYLKLGRNLNILSKEKIWKVAQSISDREAIRILGAYTAYRMNFDGDVFDRGIIATEKMKFTIAFPSDTEVSIKVQ